MLNDAGFQQKLAGTITGGLLDFLKIQTARVTK